MDEVFRGLQLPECLFDVFVFNLFVFEVVDGGVAGDGIEEGFDVGHGFHDGMVVPEGDKCLLGDIFGSRQVTHEAVGEQAQVLEGLVEDRSESPLVAVAEKFDVERWFGHLQVFDDTFE